MQERGRIPRFLKRLGAPSDEDERRRIERVLASARVFLACAAMLAIRMDATAPTRYSALANTLLAGYALYSAGAWILLRQLPELSPSWLHAVDVAFPAVFTLFTEGPNSPFFLFFVFVMMAAALRWGFTETAVTSVVISLLMSIEAVLLTYGKHFGWRLEGEFDTNRFIIRVSYVLILGVLLGYLAEQEKELRAENVFVSRTVSKARVEAGLRGTIQGILGDAMRLFCSPRALAVVQQSGSGRVFLWKTAAQSGGSSTLEGSELMPEERPQYMASPPSRSVYAQRLGSRWETLAIDRQGRRAAAGPDWLPAAYPQLGSASSVLAVQFALGEEWFGYVLLFEARLGRDKLKELRFAQKLFEQVAPAIYTVYLLRRLRSRAGAIERARVARELHDGAIQSLIAVEMQVDVLRREAARSGASAGLAERLQHVQDLLREQVLDLRTLMQQMRPVDVGPRQLLDHLSETIERFRRDTGIAAHFVCGLDEVELPPRLCRELLRIVQEALANVRKHSGARCVIVRLGLQQDVWTLAVEDDGCGLRFSGRKSLAELDAARQGPAIIKERVRTLGGELAIESQPGQGTRLEITFPQRAQAVYV